MRLILPVLSRRAAFVGATCLGLVTLADWLFYGRPLGINASLFAVALLAAVLLRAGTGLRRRPAQVIAVLLIGIVIALLYGPGPLPVALGIAGLFLLATTTHGGWTRLAAMRAADLFRAAWAVLGQALRDVRIVTRWRRARSGASTAAVAMRFGVPLLFGSTFVGLFALANPIVARALSHFTDVPAPLRMATWLLVGLGAWSLLRVRLRGLSDRAQTAIPGAPGIAERLGGTAWIVCCLMLFNALFAVQTALDLRYLVAGAELPVGMTYAEYAHRGAYPLVITALIAGLFVIGTVRPGGAAERSAAVRVLVHLFIAQNVLLLATAAWRLALYVDIYSLSRWRVAAALWMVLVAGWLLLLVVRVAARRSDRWLVQANALTLAGLLYVCCFVDFGGFIADFNVRRCREFAVLSGDTVEPERMPLDLAYLESLGPPALPALGRYLRDVAPFLSAGRVAEVRSASRRLERDLDAALSDWRGWTVRRESLRLAAR